MIRPILYAALVALLVSQSALAQAMINGVPNQGLSPSSPIRTTIYTVSGVATFNYSASAFSVVPIVQCTVENASTTNAYIPQIASKSITQAKVNVLGSTAPALSGTLLSLSSIVVGQPFAPATATPDGTAVDCAASIPTQ